MKIEDLQKENVKLKKQIEDAENAATFAKVAEIAETYLAVKQPLLPNNPTVARNWINSLLHNPLKKFKYEVDNKNIVPLDPDGYPLRDELGHKISFQKLVDTIADENFEFLKAEERQSGKNIKSSLDEPIRSFNNVFRPNPKNGNEYLKIMEDQNISLEAKQELSGRRKKGEFNF